MLLSLTYAWASRVAQTVKNLPAIQETWVQSLEKGLATHSSILAWRIQFHGQRSLEGYSPWGPKESDMTERLTLHLTYTQI